VEREDHARLMAAVQRFVGDATHFIEFERGHGDPARLSMQAVAQSLAALPTCIEVNALAHEAALAVGYLLREPAGRRLDADALISTGLVGMLLYHGRVPPLV
jgi:hypothetical protein